MGIALVVGPIVGWVIVTVISIVILVFLFKTGPSHDLGKWAPGIVFASLALTSVLTPHVAESVAQTTVAVLPSYPYAGVIGFALLIAVLLLFPLSLGILFSATSKILGNVRVRKLRIFAAALHHAGRGALMTLLIYPILVPLLYSPLYKTID